MTNQELEAAAKAYLEKENHPVFKAEVEALLKEQNWTELNERFYTSLSFGTGGLRGTIGGGTNRMNPFMVKSATQGLANYVCQAISGDKKAVVAYDSRQYSDLFALEAALVLAAAGIKTYVFKALRPTPELSFAVRKLGAHTGIVVTASHNPPEYNGYKVYWADGAQVVPPHDNGIIAEVRKTQGQFKALSEKEALDRGLLVYIDEEVDGPYRDMVIGQSLRPELVKKEGSKLKVVFTPLHGTGVTLLPQIMKTLGIELITVPEQAVPDGRFPTVDYPNPEEASAMKMALELAKKEQAHLVLGTDPDADRIGIGVPDKAGNWVLLNGNQLGSLLADYVFSTLKAQGKMPPRPAFVNTIVTTDLQNLIAESYGAQTFKVLTGFKYIGEKIREFETQKAGPQYIFGGEESYGFLLGTEVRDKDAISTAALVIEMALYHLSQGSSVLEALEDIYLRFGYFKEILISKTFKGQTGVEKMKSFMAGLRTNPPKVVGSLGLKALRDYQGGTTLTLATGKSEKNIQLPASDVVQFVLEDGSLVTVRPSGTEPKIKFYASCRAAQGVALDKAAQEVEEKIRQINTALDGWIS